MSNIFATVAVNTSLPPHLEGTLSYRVPPALRPLLIEGSLVWVPVSRQRVQGIVLELHTTPPAGVRGMREIEDLADPEAIVPGPQLSLGRWQAAEGRLPLFEALLPLLPPGVGQHVESTWQSSSAGMLAEIAALPERERAVLYVLRREGQLTEQGLSSLLRGTDADLRRACESLLERGLVIRGSRISTPKVRPRRELTVRPLIAGAELEAALEDLRRAPRQAELLRAVLEAGGPNAAVPLSELRAAGATPQLLRSLRERGLVELAERDVWRDPLSGLPPTTEPPPELTAEQARCWAALRPLLEDFNGATALLHGVTGSGKTELYLRAIARTLRLKRQALVLVPEIALTTQLVRRFAARFPGQIAVLHSGLSLGERYDQWRLLRRGELHVAIGSRSAVFAPLPDLGLIIVDEEHEPTYKHEASPRYHARDLAVQLGRISGALTVLGSATPSVESYYAATEGRYHLLPLRERVGGRVVAGVMRGAPIPLPTVEVVDMRSELKSGNRSPFSRALQAGLALTLSRGEQALLFLNRRGSAAGVLCRDCGHTIGCHRCSVPLVVHEDEAPDGPPLLRCHYCNHREMLPHHCPSCWSRRIRQFGIGTQRVAEEVAQLLPQARVLRWDRDVTGRKGSHEAILDAMLGKRADVLVGTQMIAKGLDLPLVTLVGVVAADTALHMPDFRSAERTFQLLAQVAGRAGRRGGGSVVVQSYHPDHYAIAAAQEHDYQLFYAEEIAFRRAAGYPPFTRLVRFLYSHTNAASAERTATELAEQLRALLAAWERQQHLRDWAVIGPAPAFLQRLRDRYRWQVLVRTAEPALLLSRLDLQRGWTVDIDPVSML